MNKLSPETLKELKKRWEEMQAVRNSRRTQEVIIKELSTLICDYQKDSFLPYLTQMTIHIDQRESSEVFESLKSPMKQFVYLTDLYFSVENGGNKVGFSKEEWSKITYLLNEIEMTYFGDIGFYDENKKDSPNLDKISLTFWIKINPGLCTNSFISLSSGSLIQSFGSTPLLINLSVSFGHSS